MIVKQTDEYYVIPSSKTIKRELYDKSTNNQSLSFYSLKEKINNRNLHFINFIFIRVCQKKVTPAESCRCLMQYQTDYNGDYYGEEKDGLRHGQGTMIWTDGLEYKG